MKILIAFGTTDGTTATIAARLAATARAMGCEVEVLDTRAARGHGLAGFDAVLVGGSVHAGGYQRSVRRFVRANVAALRAVPSGFFSVCLAEASKSEEERAEGRRIALAFVESLGWAPSVVQPLAGALTFSRYGLLRGFVMRRIARKEDPGVDTVHDHVYTDWGQVDGFVREVLARVDARPAPPPPPLPAQGARAASPA